VAKSVLSLLVFFEQVNFSTMSVLVDYLSRMMGGNETNASPVATPLSAKSADDVFIAESADGVFDEMLDFLAKNGDKDASGLTTALASLAPWLEAIDNRLRQFKSTADAFIARRPNGRLQEIQWSKLPIS
jgi:Tfp pilus tip-associated adhesin PilY1